MKEAEIPCDKLLVRRQSLPVDPRHNSKIDYQVLRTDVRAWLRRYRGGSRRGGLIVLADPPYATTLAAEIVRGIVALPRHSGLVTAAVEHAASVQPGFVLAVEKAVGAGWRVATRRYGNTALTLLRPPVAERTDGEGS